MHLRRLNKFNQAYLRLSSEEQARVDKALVLLSSDWRHPGLAVKRVRDTEDVWEARASRALRITFQLVGDTIILRNVGGHDKTLKDA